MLAPKAFSQTIDRDAYAAAQLTVSKKNGILRFTPAVLAFCGILLIAGLSVMFSGARTVDHLVKGLSAAAVALTGAAAVLLWLPEKVKAVADKRYPVFDTLSNHVTVTMQADDMTLSSAHMSRRVEYAKVRCCVETADRFVLITDYDQYVILEKSCFTDKEETTAFFRDVFARCYAKG